MTGQFEWKDSVMPVGPRRARMAGLPMNLRIYTTREVAVILRHSVYWVRDEIKAGRIRAKKLGTGYFVTVLELARLMGETGFKKCGVGSANSGKKSSGRTGTRKSSPASNTNGAETAKDFYGVRDAADALLTSTSTPAGKKLPRPLITSPGR